MRCRACDCELTDQESVRKDENNEYIDLCNQCFGYTEVELLNMTKELGNV